MSIINRARKHLSLLLQTIASLVLPRCGTCVLMVTIERQPDSPHAKVSLRGRSAINPEIVRGIGSTVAFLDAEARGYRIEGIPESDLPQQVH